MKQNVDSSFKAFKENTGLGFTKLTIPLIVCVFALVNCCCMLQLI